jgi:hypothetical protein
MMDDGALKHQSPDEIASEADIQGMLVLTIHNLEVLGLSLAGPHWKSAT